MRSLSLFTAFAMGFMTLSLEILGFRVLAPYFGYSTYVFGSLIGLILFSLAVGYWVGGALSEQGVRPKFFFAGIFAAALYLSLMSALYGTILEAVQEFNVVTGTLFVTFLLWGFPMAAFAAVSPYLVAMRSEKEHVGKSAGWISTAGTLGGLAGTFLTSFYLLPAFGTRTVFAGNACAAAATALIWLSLYQKKWLMALLLVPLLANLLPPPSLAENVIYAEESAYSRLEVVDLGAALGLRTDRRSNTVYSAAMKDGSLPPFLLYDLFSVPARAVEARRGLLLGLGAGTVPRIHEILNPELRLKAVEIDPRIVEIGKDFFGLGNIKNIETVVIADARPFLAREQTAYDLIEMDIFRETEVPFYLVSKEFFEVTKTLLSEDGVFVMNIYDPSSEGRVKDRVVNTAAAVYSYVYLVPAGPGSFLMTASEQPLVPPAENEIADKQLASFTAYFKAHVQTVKFDPQREIFTDDRAPIETLYGLDR